LTGKSRTLAAIYQGANGRFSKPAQYAHLIEFGVRPHAYEKRTRKGIESFMHPGFGPSPFLQPAWDAASPTLLAEIGNAAGRIVERQAAQVAAGKQS
jgi:hypothetical protein